MTTKDYCDTCAHKAGDKKAVECGTCMASYNDGVLQGSPSNYKAKPMTNADRIRAMSDEELAEFLCGVYDEENGGVYQDECGKFINGTVIFDYDQYKIEEWLKQPVGE